MVMLHTILIFILLASCFMVVMYGVMRVLVIFLVYDSFEEYMLTKSKMKVINDKIEL